MGINAFTATWQDRQASSRFYSSYARAGAVHHAWWQPV
jgi:hypothetical protein